MRILTFYSGKKGGTGKTTLSFNLLERAAAAGLKAAVVDFDPQGGSLRLAAKREQLAGVTRPFWDRFGAMVNVQGADDLATLKERDGYDLVVCDLPGQEDFTVLRVLRISDVVLAPLSSSELDVQSAKELAVHFVEERFPLWFVANNLPTHPSYRSGVVGDLSGLGLAVCPALCCRRTAYYKSTQQGLGVCELGPDTPAAAEVNALWAWLCGILEWPALAAVDSIKAAAAAARQQQLLSGLELEAEEEESVDE